ncbi:MAG TPA: NACHT domain-containing NTPase [Trichormus sp. M33_DOE_039]|nr:NACHT domain-containing NTPase [Trichormus sp. M33_DOE_039]
MPQNSLIACAAGIEKARTALNRKGWSQQQLARELQISRQPVDNFFIGKAVRNDIFRNICLKLQLNLEEVTGRVQQEEQTVNTSIDELVQQVREKIKPYIQELCGKMRVLDMSQPIESNDIYTDVNILEEITALQAREKIAQLLENSNWENFERIGLGRVVQERVSGLEAVKQYSKLMILGKPGAGKTTFLKRIAMQCNLGCFLGDRVPIFITLKAFAEEPQQPSLLHYINEQFALNDISAQEITKTVLRQSRAIMLLDGLDEVKQADNDRVIREIEKFSTQYYGNCFLITCRIAANEYKFKNFTEVEVADFDEKQITEFANKWFQTKKDPIKAQKFIEKLEQNLPIKELATNPLLLTLLCLLFGESTDFPSSRSELYQEGVDVLLKKWDGTRSIDRNQVYHKLSLKRKQDLLSKIALETFEKGNYFFKEKDAEEYISNYIQNLPDTQNDPEALLLESKAVLKSIEAQHGLLVERARRIYSFSHLTFHEFFTARNIALSRNPQQAFQQLVSHITDKRWREVFLLTVGMLGDADELLQLMKHRIDNLVATDDQLQKFLTWVEEKSCSVKTSYKSSAIRAFYLSLSRSLYLDLSRSLSLSLSLSRSFDLYLDFYLYLDLSRSRSLDLSRSLGLSRFLDLFRSLDLYLDCSLDLYLELKPLLQQLKDQLLNVYDPDAPEAFKYWWKENGQAWTEQLRAFMIEHRNIGHDWQFSKEQKELLQQYYDANKLLIDCLNSECYVSRDVRQHIEDTLLLPVKTIPS